MYVWRTVSNQLKFSNQKMPNIKPTGNYNSVV